MFRIGENEVRLPICKRLSKDEKDYLKFLHDGIDNNIQYAVKWLSSNDALELLSVDEDDFEDEFVNSDLYSNLNNFFLKNKIDNEKFINKL